VTEPGRSVFADVFGIGMPVAAAVGFLLGWWAGGDGGTSGALGASIGGVIGVPICLVVGNFIKRAGRAAAAGQARPPVMATVFSAAGLGALGALVIFVATSAAGSGETAASPSAGPAPSTPVPVSSRAESTRPPSPSPAASPAGSAWPVDANDGSPAMWAYFGTEFFFPDWVACERTYCLAAEADQIHVYQVRPIKRVRTFDTGDGDPYSTLVEQRFTDAQARALLDR
jgi:hypothetical protein